MMSGSVRLRNQQEEFRGNRAWKLGESPRTVVKKITLQMPQPFTAIIPADALDVSGLPPHARKPGTQDFKKAVSEGFGDACRGFQRFKPGADVGIDLSREYAAVAGR